ncbi:MAG: hypothetical protein MJ200_02685 [Mycoplasmoidaceae bacterium]|nr:hypothetical protein [Mycoplasmoidaceae bacterium]
MDLDIHLLIDDSVITAKKSVPLDFGLKFTITNKVNPFYTPKVFNFTKLSVQ